MGQRFGLVIDLERCLGCEACTVACGLEHGGQGRIRVETLGAPRKDTPAGRFPEVTMTFLPRLCNHCDDPPCEDVCPSGALHRQDNGLVLLDPGQCEGCGACVEACPYGAIQIDDERGTAEKCNLCSHRVLAGQEPFCALCCEGQAIHFGDLNDPSSRVSALIQRADAFCLKPEAGTRPRVYYLPPKPPRGI